MTYHVAQKVLFKHCDPAGIVFYPRYFELINDVLEDWFDKSLGAPWEELHPTNAVPTVQIEVAFKAPSHHGEMLDLRVNTIRVGNTSASVRVVASCVGQTRFVSNSTLVYIDENMRPASWTPELRTKLEGHLINEGEQVT